jgi:MerR family transcriptional regulator, copper efflux regulator
MNTNGPMTVGAVAKRAGINVDTIRYYERRGLLAKPDRNLAGYRTFAEATVQRLCFIKRAQKLGFTLNEIQQLITLRVTPGTRCSAARRQAEMKLADFERRIRSLQEMHKALLELVSACAADRPADECSFLANLHSEE